MVLFDLILGFVFELTVSTFTLEIFNELVCGDIVWLQKFYELLLNVRIISHFELL